MIRHEGLNEVVAVIVARLQAQVQRLARLRGGGGELLRQQLFGEKWVARALVDENVPGKLPARDEFAGVVFAPCLGVLAQIIAEGLLAPGALHGRRNGRECGNRPKRLRIAQRAHQRAVPAHGMTEDPGRFGPRGEVGGDELRQFPGDVAVHPIVLRPGSGGGIDVEAGRVSEIPVVGIAGQARLARARVRRDQHQPQLRRRFLGMRLDGKGFLRAGEPRQVEQHGHFGVARLRGYESCEFHRSADFLRVVLVEPLVTAEASVLGHERRGAHQYTTTLRIDSPECIRSNALLMSASGILWVMRSSMLILPSIYQSTILGTSVRPRAPPNAVPFQTRPVTSWNGRAPFSCPEAATPTLTKHSNEKSAPPPVRSTDACTTLARPTSSGLTKCVMPNFLAISWRARLM